MQNIDSTEEDASRLLELLTSIGRRNSLRDPLAALVEDAGLGAAQVHALMWVFRDGPLTMGAVAQRLGVSDKTVTGIVDRLERSGFVARERHADDRRVVHVVLSEAGREIAATIEKEIHRKMGLFLGFLEPQDRRDLLRILERLVAKLDSRFLAVPVAPPADPS